MLQNKTPICEYPSVFTVTQTAVTWDNIGPDRIKPYNDVALDGGGGLSLV